MYGILKTLVLVAVLGAAGTAQAVTINFNDGTGGMAIGSFYAGYGITFDNAAWKNPINNQSGTPSEGLFLVDITDTGRNSPYTPQADSPIIGMFSSPQSSISILAVDIGQNGVQIDAYDSPVGGNLVASDNYVGSGAGIGVFLTLQVNSPTIQRIELYQLDDQSGDGLFFDNLTFIPEPASGLLLALGFTACGFRPRRIG